jgi:hypothetical protein
MSAMFGFGAARGRRAAGATLDLNWQAETPLDSRVTFTRSTTATRINSAGMIDSVAVDGFRFDYDPATLAPLGRLVEDQRTNLLLNCLLNGTALSTQSVSVTAQAYTLSFYGTGSVTLSGAATAVVNGSGAYPGRAAYTFTPGAGNLTLTVSGSVQFAQLEAGSFATSFIPTASAQVTRAADNVSMTGANFSSWFNPAAGAVVVDGDIIDTSSAVAVAWSLTNATGTDSITAYRASGLFLSQCLVASTSQVSVNHGAVPTNTRFRHAYAYKADDFAASLNGGTVLTDTSGSLPTVDRLQIGNRTSVYRWNGHIRSLKYYPTRKSNAELQAMTA